MSGYRRKYLPFAGNAVEIDQADWETEENAGPERMRKLGSSSKTCLGRAAGSSMTSIDQYRPSETAKRPSLVVGDTQAVRKTGACPAPVEASGSVWSPPCSPPVPDGAKTRRPAYLWSNHMAEKTGVRRSSVVSSSSEDDNPEPHRHAAGPRKFSKHQQRPSMGHSASGSSSKPSMAARDARPKTKKTEEQKEILNKYFKQDRRPPKGVHYMISRETRLTVDEVINWFRNKRCRSRDANQPPLQAGQQLGAISSPGLQSPQQHHWPPTSPAQVSHMTHSPRYPFPQDSLLQQQQLSPFPASDTSSISDRPSLQQAHIPLAQSRQSSASSHEDDSLAQLNGLPPHLPYTMYSPFDVYNRATETRLQSAHDEMPPTALPGIPEFPQYPAQPEAQLRRHSACSSAMFEQPVRRPSQQSLVDFSSSFLTLFQQFDPNGIERNRMLSTLLQQLSQEERSLVSQHLSQTSVAPVSASKPFRERVRMAWHEVKRIFTLRPTPKDPLVQRRKKLSTDSGNCSRSDTDADRVVNGTTDVFSRLNLAAYPPASSSDDDSNSGCDDGAPGSHRSSGSSLHDLRAGGHVDQHVVLGLVAMLKAHKQYILPIYKELQMLLPPDPPVSLYLPHDPSFSQFPSADWASPIGNGNPGHTMLPPSDSSHPYFHQQAPAGCGLDVVNMDPDTYCSLAGFI